MSYGNLKTIARILKETGQRMTGKPVQLGAAFDPRGEFAVSDFMLANDTRSFVQDSLPYSREEESTRFVIRGITGQLVVAW